MRKSCCAGNPLSRRSHRRDFLTVGALGALGLSLGDLFRLQHAMADDAPGGAAKVSTPKAQGVLHIFLPGGMAHQESFDPKPLAPLEYRGSFGAVKTSLPGVHFCETIPKIAGVADKLTVVRSMSHGEAAHERGTHNMFTGYKPSPSIVYPSMGSIVSHELGTRNNLPPYVCVPNQPDPFAGTGYLSSAYGPFNLGSDPAGGGFKVRDLALPDGVDEERFARRRSMLDAVNEHFAAKENADALDAVDTFYQRAYQLLSSPEAREAFNIDAEPDAVRDAYGRNQAGQRMLLARRLLAAGVRLVSMTYGGWDFHVDIVSGTRRLTPDLDHALAALINDLDQTGLLETTLVVLSTEFGRTPRINSDAGRDHWPRVFSIMLAGGGIGRGQVFGASSATAADVESDPLSPEDLFATMYHLMGVDFEKKLLAPGDRPIDIVSGGKVRRELLA